MTSISKTEAAFIELIRCALEDRTPDQTEEMLAEVFPLAKKQSLSALTYLAVSKLPIKNEITAKWREENLKAIRKQAMFDAERAKVYEMLENIGSWYMPLKGLILRDYYPQPYLRQMSDNDILFDRSYRGQVKTYFFSQGYEQEQEEDEWIIHDVYVKKPNLNFEMHFDLFDEDYGNDHFVAYYKNVRERLTDTTDSKCRKAFRPEDFYLYTKVHEYKHFRYYGTGLRSLVDTYLYLKAEGDTLDWAYIQQELEKLGIAAYERDARDLAEQLFTGQELNPQQEEMLTYYLRGGTYGSIGNYVRHKMEGESKGKYIWHRLFPDDELMAAWCKMYAPKLGEKKHYRIARIYRLLTHGLSGKGQKEIETLKQMK